jgi:hypothetical protein
MSIQREPRAGSVVLTWLFTGNDRPG